MGCVDYMINANANKIYQYEQPLFLKDKPFSNI